MEMPATARASLARCRSPCHAGAQLHFVQTGLQRLITEAHIHLVLCRLAPPACPRSSRTPYPVSAFCAGFTQPSNGGSDALKLVLLCRLRGCQCLPQRDQQHAYAHIYYAALTCTQVAMVAYHLCGAGASFMVPAGSPTLNVSDPFSYYTQVLTFQVSSPPAELLQLQPTPLSTKQAVPKGALLHLCNTLQNGGPDGACAWCRPTATPQAPWAATPQV